MVRTIVEASSDETKAPAGSTIIETQESNLDSIEIVTTRNIEFTDLEEFEYKDQDENILFAGAIRKKESGPINVANGFDWSIELAEIPIRKNYENQTPLQIIEDIITNFTRLTFVNNGVTTSEQIPLFPARDKANILVDQMLRVLGATSYTDKDKNYTIEFEGEDLNSKILTVGSNCSMIEDGWSIDTSMICKTLSVNGGKYSTTEIFYLSGDNSTTEFTLAQPYTNIEIEYPVGTPLTAGVDDVIEGDYKMKPQVKKIDFNTAPVTGTDNIKVYLTYDIETNFNIGSPSLKISNNENPHHHEITLTYIKDVNTCRLYAYKYYEKFSNPIRSTKLFIQNTIDNRVYRPNERIRVVDNIIGIGGSYVDEEFIIKRVERRFGNGSTILELTVGDSTQLVFDREAEIKSRIDDLNVGNATALVFNEGIETLDTNPVLLEVDVEVSLLVADLPTNILVYDASRTYINDGVTGTTYEYIDEQDYEDLFN